MDKIYYNAHICEFKILEAIRKSATINMYGAAPYLAEEAGISKNEAEYNCPVTGCPFPLDCGSAECKEYRLKYLLQQAEKRLKEVVK